MFADAAKEGRLLSGDTHPVRNGLFVVFALFFATFLVHMIPTMADWWRVQAAGEVIEVVEEGTWVEVAYTWREERLTKRVFADLEVGDAVDLWVHPLDPTNVERQPLIPPLPWRIVVNAMFASGFLFLFTVAVFMVWLLGSPATGGSRDLQRAALEVTTGTVASAVAQWLCGVGWLPAILWCFLDGWVAGALAETWERFSASPSNVPAAS